jgi:hypothetical protein
VITKRQIKKEDDMKDSLKFQNPDIRKGGFMKKTALSVFLILLSVFLLMNIHIIRTGDGLEIITKDTPGFRDTFADVREWGFQDYLTCSPRIRNYLIYEKHYTAIAEALEKKTGTAKIKLGEAKEAVCGWFSEKLNK